MYQYRFLENRFFVFPKRIRDLLHHVVDGIDKGNFDRDMSTLFREKGIKYLSWNGDTTYTNHPNLFYDMTHLNEIGAMVFTKDFIRQLKKNAF